MYIYLGATWSAYPAPFHLLQPPHLVPFRETMSLHAEEDEMHPALQHESSISISSLFELCVCNFRTLVSTLLSQARPTDVISSFQEEFGRLRIWAGNFSAQREETDNQSLDYALKDAPELYREVIDHFYDLDEVVKEGTFIRPFKPLNNHLMVPSHGDFVGREDLVCN